MRGQTISHSTTLTRLGEAGMGAAHKIHRTGLYSEVALRPLPLEPAKGPEIKGRFIQSAKRVLILLHPNLWTIHDINQSPASVLFMGIVLYEGNNLNKEIQSGSLRILAKGM